MFARVNAALDIVGLREFANRSPYALSGGEMQRAALACILVMEPRVLVLDEPTAQLDPIGTRELFRALRALISERHCTVVLVEQKIEWIATFADRVIALQDGTIALDGIARVVLTSARLDEIGISVPRYTLAARAAREQGLWQRELELPATFEQAVRGFQTRSSE
jgi:energy-coupling factor transporter ATP-binding protein EcfA2